MDLNFKKLLVSSFIAGRRDTCGDPHALDWLSAIAGARRSPFASRYTSVRSPEHPGDSCNPHCRLLHIGPESRAKRKLFRVISPDLGTSGLINPESRITGQVP
jgi:hypothetical protein